MEQRTARDETDLNLNTRKLANFKGIFFKTSVSITLLLYLFFTINLSPLKEALATIDITLFLLALFLYLLAQPIRTLRWWLLLKKDNRLPFSSLLALCFIGMFFNQFLPTSIGGDVVRGYYLWKETDKKEHALSSIVMERFAGFYMLFLLSLVASLSALIRIGRSPLFVFVLVASVIILIVMTLFFIPPLFELINRRLFLHRLGISEKVAHVYYATLEYRRERVLLLNASLLSLLFQVMLILVYYFLSLSLHVSLPVGYFFLLVPMVTAAAMIPFSLNGLGIREGVSVLLFSRAGITNAQALTIALVMLFVGLLTGLIGGLIYPFFRSEVLQKKEVKDKSL
jgi:hypothetical protein